MGHRVSSRTQKTLLALGFLAAALAMYASALNAGFVADDWPFLAGIDVARSPLMIFDPLVGRYLRPLVVLLYYGNFQLFGLWPLPYHVSVVALHALNGWLLCLLVTKLDGRRSIGVLTGMLFVAFAGHSEAVTWIAGVADVLLAPFILGALVLMAHGLEADRPAHWLVPAALLLPMGLMAKETAVIGPVLAAALCMFIASRSAAPARVLRRGVAVVALPVAAVAAYLLLRTRLFGNPVGAYSDLATSTGMFFRELRAFTLRVFLPAYSRLAIAWARNQDLLLLAAGAAVVLAAFLRQRERRNLLLFTIAAIAITLGPALPLTISLSTTETERVVYIPTAFGALLTVLVVDALVKSIAVQRLILVALIAGHALMLQRFNRNWVEAGIAFETITRTFVETARAHDPGPAGLFFILNLPDNVRGAYVYRRGFYEGLHFVAPDLETRHTSIFWISSHTLWRGTGPVVARQIGPREFSLDVAPNRFLQTVPPARPFVYDFTEWTPQGYRLRFTSAFGKAVVFRMTEGRIHFVTDIEGDGTPFGVVDIPSDPATCSGSLRFAGWALDDEVVERVSLSLDAPPGAAPGAAPLPLGDAAWAYNTRPDVVGAFEAFPHTDRAEWNFQVPCDRVPPPSARIRVVAHDRAGHALEIGTRIVNRQ